jgi:tetratricopeptide (TPR) repeat protein
LASAEAQAKAVEERKRRKVTLAFASSVLAFVVVGAAGGFWVQHLHNQRQADLARQELEQRQDVESALEKIAALQKAARWKEAEAVLGQASARLGESGPADLRQAVAQAQDEVHFAAKLDRIRMEKATDAMRKVNRTAPAYAQAFRDYGLEITTDDVAVLAERIATSHIKQQLVAALDDWDSMSGDLGTSSRLWAILSRVDPDEWRVAYYLALKNQDPQAFQRLAARIDVEKLSPAFLDSMATRLKKTGADALSLLERAQQQYPDDFWLNFSLANAWELRSRDRKTPFHTEAIGYYRAALAVRPNSLAYMFLGGALQETGRLDESLAACQNAVRLDPNSSGAHAMLGVNLALMGRADEAILALEKAIALDSKDPNFYGALGIALKQKGRFDESIAAHGRAIKIDPDYAEFHFHLGTALLAKGDLDEAITAFRKAIALDHKLPLAHDTLGCALVRNGDLDGAITAFRQAIAVDDKVALPYTNLGAALEAKGDLDAAITAHGKAIALDPQLAVAHCNLGLTLQKAGRFVDALDSLKRGHELGMRTSGWTHPSAQWINQCERLLELDQKLPRILEGEADPQDASERLALGELCQWYRKRYVAAARFYGEAFEAEPQLAELKSPAFRHSIHRYNAACCAALAGCGKGEDAALLDDKDLVRLRNQARAWLRADLQAWAKWADKGKADDRASAVKTLQHWKTDTDLAGVRDREPLAQLPEAEQEAWRKLWADVEELLKKAQEAKSAGRP